MLIRFSSRLFTKRWQWLRVFCFSFMIVSVLSSMHVAADDTEIFFAGESDSSASRANLLFMFDTSGSMASTDNTGISRLSRLKEAMISVVQSTQNVNIAIGSFAGSNKGSIQLPVIGVDEDVCANALCESIKVRAQIKTGTDDGEQFPNGTIDLRSEDLEVNIPTNPNPTNANLWALRFDDLNIPRGATINEARLQFTSDLVYNRSTELVIVGEATDDSLPLNTSANNLRKRKAPGLTTTGPIEWDLPTWNKRASSSPDIKSIVSQITGRSGWCGGNALTLLVSGTGNNRIAHSYESDQFKAPVLQIDYSPASVDWSDTCVRTESVAHINHGSGDVTEDAVTSVIDDESDLLQTHIAGNSQAIGLRFDELSIPAGATVSSAYLSLSLDSSASGIVDLSIAVEDDESPVIFDASQAADLTNRSFLTQEVLWPEVPERGSAVKSTDISVLVSHIINKPGWEGSGAMTFKLTPVNGGSGERYFSSADAPAGRGATLVVHYQRNSAELGASAPVLQTGRDLMIRTMMNYEATGGTPFVDALYEASSYMRGGEAVYGSADGSTNYANPEFGECMTSQIVMLSDGQTGSNSSKDLIRTLIGDAAADDTDSSPSAAQTTDLCADRSRSTEECGIELAAWMNATDHDNITEGKQPVITHTIGFNISTQYMRDIATAGDGTFYEASSAAELSSVFKNIFRTAITQDTGFVAPSSSANLENRLVNNNALYFALFKPSTKTLWDGNLKRYELGANQTTGKLEIRDSLGLVATNSDGSIKESAKSIWSTQKDGNEVGEGGAASRMTLTRNLYTSMYDATSGTMQMRNFNEATASIDNDALGIQGENSTYRNRLMQWARGVDIKNFDDDTDTTEVRSQMGDPMHSTQFILQYAAKQGEEASQSTDTSDTADNAQASEANDPTSRSVLFVGTNHGFLHAFDTNNGTEKFAYIPEELLPNLDYYYRDAAVKSDERPYGLDGEISGWHEDSNNNGMVDGNEKAYIYFGMRRGGRNYYALDVTDPDKPEFAWIIKGGEGDFAELAQTWSRPVKAKVKHKNVDKDVLFFAAGYDDRNDNEFVQLPDTRGRGLFMVDAVSGDLLSKRGIGQFDEMLYSIPSDLRVINTDADAYADAIFVGDTGGQLWRFDIDNTQTTDTTFFSGAVIAKVAGIWPSQNRRFFNEPDVAIVKGRDGNMFLNIAIGSGSRPDPNSEIVEDGFYSFRDYSIYGPPRNVDGIISYPTAVTETQMADLSSSLATAEHGVKLATGWFFRFTATGEKALSTALTIDNELMFTTYVPAAPKADDCSALIGSGRVYTVSVLDGNPVGNSDVITDRYTDLKQPGIPPRVVGLIVEAAPDKVSRFVGTEAVETDRNSELLQRTFWAEE